jgi:WD40 repeat protein
MRFSWNVALLCGALACFTPAASAGQLFYDFSGGSLNTLTAIDTSTGVATTIGTGTGYFSLYSSAFNTDGTFYALGQTATGAPAFISVNLVTGVGTLVATPPASMYGLEAASDDTIYTTENGDLYKVPPGGSPTQVGTNSMGVANFMDFAMDSFGDLYAVGSSTSMTGTSRIYTINTTTGVGTLVGTLPNNPCLMGIAFDASNNLFATEYCGGPYPLYEITGLSVSNPSGAIATAIGTGTGVASLHGGDIDNFTPEPASLMLCLLGGALLAARRLRRAG